MRIAFIPHTGARAEGSWPAIARSMSEAFVRSGHHVLQLQEPQVEHGLLWSARKAGHKLTGTDFYPERELQVAQGFARQIEREVHGDWPDMIFSSSSLPLACLEAPCPTAFWTDATFAGITGFYKEFSRMSMSTLRNGNALEQVALANVSHSFYTSEWAASSAIRDHGADPERVHVVPFGPNLSTLPPPGQVGEWIAGRGRERCDLLFIGYDWERKGGPTAVAVLAALRALGVPAFLTVIGCEPPGQPPAPGLQVIGRLDKDDPPQRRAIEHALAHSHFLLVPSKAECFGVVYCEASAFGVPSLACRVGGVASAVSDGMNGLLFEPAERPAQIAERVAHLWNDREAYERLARSSHASSIARLNWDVSVARILEVMRA